MHSWDDPWTAATTVKGLCYMEKAKKRPGTAKEHNKTKRTCNQPKLTPISTTHRPLGTIERAAHESSRTTPAQQP